MDLAVAPKAIALRDPILRRAEEVFLGVCESLTDVNDAIAVEVESIPTSPTEIGLAAIKVRNQIAGIEGIEVLALPYLLRVQWIVF